MPFVNYLCWNPRRAAELLNAEAEQLSPEFFAATHSPVSARRMVYTPPIPGGDRGGALSSGETITEQQILTEFMVGARGFGAEDRGFDGNVFMPIIGPVGSGKTHLVKWLHAQIPPIDKRRRVILVPKLNTSLRQVLKLMIGDLEGPEFDKFRAALGASVADGGDAVTMRKLLLAMLAVVVSEGVGDPVRTAMEQDIRRNLPAFLNDNFIQNHLLNEGCFIDRVASNAVGEDNYEQQLLHQERPYEFTVADLQLDVMSRAEVNKQAGRAAANFYNFLATDIQVREATVAWVDQKVHDAIRNLLQLGGVDLGSLMKLTRQQLKREGTELVVLIEDYARLQGVDRALLEALLARPRQAGEDDLCNIRTAIACTSGHYDRVPDTARARAALHIEVGGLANEDGVQIQDWSMFAARYLNALRLDHRSQGQPKGPSNPCDQCIHRTSCHAAFGTATLSLNHGHDEPPSVVGLYPFNLELLAKTRRRVLANFNPRTATQRVLKPILGEHSHRIADGNFPPQALVTELGGPQVPAAVSARLRRHPSSERQIGLVDLWSSTSEEGGVRDTVRTAFGLSPLNANNQENGPGNAIVVTVPQEATTAVVTPLSVDKWTRLVHNLDSWSNGTALPAAAISDLREVVFASIAAEVDWIGNGFEQDFYAKPTHALFRKTGICFNGEDPEGAIRLQIPSAPGLAMRAEAAVALQALVTNWSLRRWNLDDGTVTAGYIAARSHVQKWAESVLKQIVGLYGSGSESDPIPPAVESLCLFQILCGRTIEPECTDKDAVDFLFQPIRVADPTTRSASWRELQQRLNLEIDTVRTALLSLVGCTKGGRGEVYLVSPDRILPLIRRTLQSCVASDFRIQQLDRAGRGVEGLALRRCNELLRRHLARALDEDTAESKKSCNALEALFGLDEAGDLSDEAITQSLDLAKDAVAAARQLGVVGGPATVEKINDAIAALRCAGLGGLLAAYREVRSATGHFRLPAAARVPSATRQEVLDAMATLRAFLSGTVPALERECKEVGIGSGADAAVQTIVDRLESLASIVRSLEPGGTE